ncbi:hypothetical protein ACFV6D_15345 [Kitasatospora sp. NPDC059812]|uniref:hypothetical protein n=1 Tax=Kitasatospora sp. NPDC059812 TaxID=3346958 RepID=UPI0007AFDC55
MTLDRDIVTLTRRIQRESGDTIPFRQARLTAARELGGLPVHTMTAEERIPLRIQYTAESEAAETRRRLPGGAGHCHARTV